MTGYNYFCFLLIHAHLLLRLFETPLLDILLIILLLRFLFPSLFGIQSKAKQQAERERIVIRDAAAKQNREEQKQEGKYIDYEEIK